MSSDEDDVVIPLLWQFLLNSEINKNKRKRKIWVHEINKKRTENNTIFNFLAELRKDELKFKNFTRMSSTTFDFILNEIGEAIRSQDTNFRQSIAPAEKLLVTLR